MKRLRNSSGGTTLVLGPGSELSDVPASHRDMVSGEIERAFADPAEYFRRLSAAWVPSSFSEWLNALVSDGEWTLEVADTYLPERETWAGFRWRAPGVLGALIEPGGEEPVHRQQLMPHKILRGVHLVHWEEVGMAGGLFREAEHVLLSNYGIPSRNDEFRGDQSFVFGSTACGDVFVYNPTGTAGFVSHETGDAYSLGSIADSLEWLFGELLMGREPCFDYGMVRRLNDDDDRPPSLSIWCGE